MQQGKKKLSSQVNLLFRLGVIELGDVVDSKSQRLFGFEDVKSSLYLPPNYGFVWE